MNPIADFWCVYSQQRLDEQKENGAHKLYYYSLQKSAPLVAWLLSVLKIFAINEIFIAAVKLQTRFSSSFQITWNLLHLF